MKTIDMYILAEFIDCEMITDKLENFLSRRDFTKEEIKKALEELGLN